MTNETFVYYTFYVFLKEGATRTMQNFIYDINIEIDNP